MIESTVEFGSMSIQMGAPVEKKSIACVYHDTCVDGFASAYILGNALGRDKVDFYPAQYGKPTPAGLEGYNEVYIVDFSFKRDELNRLASLNKGIVVLDHHKTAREELMMCDDENGYIWKKHSDLAHNIFPIFTMELSGAQITYAFFYAQFLNEFDDKEWLNLALKNFPRWVNLIGMRDLWNHKKEQWKAEWEAPCEEFNAGINSRPFTFENWDSALQHLDRLLWAGSAVNRYIKQTVDSLAKGAKVINTRFGQVPIANAGGMFASELGNKLCKGMPFSMTWFLDGEFNVICSLRSDQDSPHSADVSKVAKTYGGGGHKHAAGFKMLFDEFHNRFLQVDPILHGDGQNDTVRS